MNNNLKQFHIISNDELQTINGGAIGFAEIGAISGAINVAIGIFNAGYRFGADLAKRGR